MLGKIMVLNLGSTSYKFKLFDLSDGEKMLAVGCVESIGATKSTWQFKAGNISRNGEIHCSNHEAAFAHCLEQLKKAEIIISLKELDGIGFKAVHGGEHKEAQVVDYKLLDLMMYNASFAPAHNPVYVQLMSKLLKSEPELKQIACFETSFHNSIPPYRKIYGVPYEWIAKYGIRRYGFHGSSHGYIASKMNELAPTAKKIISLHLGGSSSICAIADGQSVATSMGATPQSGLFQNNRVGDFDIFCLPRLVEAYDGDVSAVMHELATNGGFLGLSGISNDLREVIQAAKNGNSQAQLTIDAFIDNCVGYIGMFNAYLQGVDALVFTGGIGLRSSLIRELICDKLNFMGISLDEDCTIGKISTCDSIIKVWVLDTNEELMVARQVAQVLRS